MNSLRDLISMMFNEMKMFVKDTYHVVTCDAVNCSWIRPSDDWTHTKDEPVDRMPLYSKKEYVDGEWVKVSDIFPRTKD